MAAKTTSGSGFHFRFVFCVLDLVDSAKISHASVDILKDHLHLKRHERAASKPGNGQPLGQFPLAHFRNDFPYPARLGLELGVGLVGLG